MITPERREEILDRLGAKTCESCGAPKDSGMSHCRACYYSLPINARRDLYKLFGRGYEEAFEKSLELLKAKREAGEKS